MITFTLRGDNEYEIECTRCGERDIMRKPDDTDLEAWKRQCRTAHKRYH